MPRRRNASTTEQALAASVAANRQLRAELDAAEKKLAESEKILRAERRQLDFHRAELVTTEAALAEQRLQADQLQHRVDSLAHRLELERDHTAGSCSHAADLKAMGEQVTALERRVAELQRANEGHESLGWAARPVAPQTSKRWR